jgi:putative heme-binding domain-containing protein
MKMPRSFVLTRLALASGCLLACSQLPAQQFDPAVEKFVNQFKGRGALEDGSKSPTPQESLGRMKVAPGFEVDLVASEPLVRQPINLHFDARGRLWVVQYIQYPFPAGLKVVKYDQHLRAVFDKVPEPPPKGPKGADKITILEDTDGDGKFDKSKDFITGLNIATSVTTGRGGVWVLNPPYLLFYPDRNRDDIPDGPPEVHLFGFGLEDTHAVASSLNWGPDGWLYGAQGSTTTATVKGRHFDGQAIWRYHPVTKEFEVFAEGGGNTFSLDFDSKGRAFSGTNHGDTRGLHYVQGGAYIKNWSKHGPLINPYSFGWFEHMANKGFQPRFAQSMILYEGGAMPPLEGQIIAGMALVNRVQASAVNRDTSTYATVDTVTLIESTERWFRPVDTEPGPDGAIYLADWCDSRLTHVDPRDTWDRSNGRIYRIKTKDVKPVKPFDLARLGNDELIGHFSNPNRWYRQTVQRILADRHDKGIVPKLKAIVDKEGQLALEAFWAVNSSGGFDDAFALKQLSHPNEHVRSWTIRLLGDARKVSSPLQQKLLTLARTEPEVQVRSQLLCSAKRLPGVDALPIIRELLLHSEDAGDKHLPLLNWWALESKAASDRNRVIAMFKESSLWQAPMVNRHIVARLGQRYTAERGDDNLRTAAELLSLAPSAAEADLLVKGMELGLQGDTVKSVPPEMQKQLANLWATHPHTPTLVNVATRLGHPEAIQEVLVKVADSKVPEGDRRKFMVILGERRVEKAVPVFIELLQKEKSEGLRLELLNSLQRFTDGKIARTILDLYPGMSAKLRTPALGILSSRAEWARLMLEAVDGGTFKKEQVAPGNLIAIQNHRDLRCEELIKKHWGKLGQSSAEKEAKVADVRKLLARGKGDANNGRELFKLVCATCHTLNREGGRAGPDLTGYERDNLDFMLPAIIDPSLGIREEYTSYNVITKDDQNLTGFIVESSPQSVTIMDLSQSRVLLAREQIKSLAASPTSLMPEGLLDAMNESQIRDLFSYLTQRK